MNYLKKKLLQNKAFSMIELSVFILFLALILTAIIAVKSSEKESEAKKVTKERLEIIQQALNSYAASTKALPCPADLTQIKSSSATYGAAVTATNDTCPTASGVYESGTRIYYGGVPFKTLGIDEKNAEDGFGAKITYVVKGQFVSSGINYFNNRIISGTQIQVNGVNSNAMYLLMSGGKNKSGFFNSNSSSRNTTSAINDELENINTTDANFIQTSTNIGFDDIVVFKTRDQILGEIKADTTTKKCLGSSASVITRGTTNMTWPDADAGQIVASTTACPSTCTGSPLTRWNAGVYTPTRKCLSNGTWESTLTNDCTSTTSGCNICTSSSSYVFGNTTVTWPPSPAGDIISPDPCPSNCYNGTRYNGPGSPANPGRTCNSNGTWGSLTSPTCYGYTCGCTLTNGQIIGNSQYTGATKTLQENETQSLTCRSGNGRRPKNAAPYTGASGGISCGRTQYANQFDDRITSDPYVTCGGGGILYLSDDCTSCRSCTSSTPIRGDTGEGPPFVATDRTGISNSFTLAHFGAIPSTGHGGSYGRCRYTYNRNAFNGGGCSWCQFSKVYLIMSCIDGMYFPDSNPKAANCMTPEDDAELGPSGSGCQDRPASEYISELRANPHGC